MKSTASFLALFALGLTIAPAQAMDYTTDLYHLHHGDRPVPSPWVAQEDFADVHAVDVVYGQVGGKPVTGYLAHGKGPGPRPAIMVIHEWWGLNDNIKTMTRRLASLGYTVLAVDLFGAVATTPEAAREQMQKALGDPGLLQENLRQAYRYLEEKEKAPKIASLGWCFGGSWSLQAALLYPKELDAAVIYYGGNLVTDSQALASLEMPILGIFGGLDTSPNVDTVRTFETNLHRLGKRAAVYIYDDANHAFANPSGMNYNAPAARSAWIKTVGFLREYLGS